MKVSVLTCALVLPLASFGLIRSGHSSAQQKVIGDWYGAAAVNTLKPNRAPETLTQTGTPFSSKEGKFSIKLPPEFPAFQHKQQAQTTSVGNIELHIYSTETSRGACILGYSDFPPASFEGRSAQKTLEDGRDGALKNVNGTMEKQESITVQGYPGITVYATASSEEKIVYVRLEFVLAKPRAYQIMYLAYDRASLDKPEIQAYFKSFRMED